MPGAPRPVTIPGSGAQPSLEGAWFGDGSTAAIVAPPHPLMGGHLSNPVVQAIVDGFVAAGLACLAFNFRGVGDSNGDASGDPADAENDYRTALSFAGLSTTVVVAAGYSFGGATAIRVAAQRGPLAAFAVAPPPALLEGEVLASFAGRLAVVAAERDTIAPHADLERALASNRSARVDKVLHADHFFGGALPPVRAAAERFARECLPG